NPRAASLKRFAIRTRRDLAIGILARQPHFNVISFRRGESEVAGGKRDSAIRKTEFLEHRFSIARQRFEFVIRILRASDLHQLDLVELMLPNKPASVLSVAPGFGPEARRVRGHLYRQPAAVQYFIGIDVRERHFGRRYQI